MTLLAWGNGAPDIFSSIAAVKAGQYELALGGQFGAESANRCVSVVTGFCTGMAVCTWEPVQGQASK